MSRLTVPTKNTLRKRNIRGTNEVPERPESLIIKNPVNSPEILHVVVNIGNTASLGWDNNVCFHLVEHETIG